MTNYTPTERDLQQLRNDGYDDLVDYIELLSEENRRLIVVRNQKGEELGKLRRKVEQLERELDAHKELLYVVDGYYQDYVQKNYGSAEEWLRHIINQYSKIFNGEFDGVSPLVQHNIEQQLIAVRKCKVGSIEWIVQHEQWLEEQLRKQQEKE